MPAETPTVPRAIGLGRVALVVDDEPILRLEAIDVLEEAGFTVLDVGNARSALQVLEERNDIALLVTDVHLWRGQEGVELAHQVADRWPPIAIVVCSSLPQYLIRMLPTKARFVDRPTSPKRMMETVRQVLPARPS